MKPNKILLAILCLAAILRLSFLDTNPPALYWDEASLGYNAFSIMKAGIDEHGVSFPITHFLAYGDAKPPLYIYAIVPFMKVFGVNSWSIRLPSAVAGVVAVWLSYLLAVQILKSLKLPKSLKISPKRYGLLVAFLLTLSPWHLQMSRAAFEANLALTLFLAGTFCFFKAKKKPFYFLLSAIFYVLTWYTFNAYRLFLPPFLIVLGLMSLKILKSSKNLKWVIGSIVAALIMTAPLIPFVLSDQAALRYNEVTIFNDLDPVVDSNTRQELNGNSLWAKVLYNRRVLYAAEFFDGYVDHLKADFLFFSGDVNPRLGLRDIGVMYAFEIVFLLSGAYVLFCSKGKGRILLLSWFLLSIIPGAVARETPHALRILQILPIPQFVVALGIMHLLELSKKYTSRLSGQSSEGTNKTDSESITISKISTSVVVGLYVIGLAFYLNLYYRHYRILWEDSWQYGYEEMVDYVLSVQDDYDRIYITNKLGRPHTYMLLYSEYDPREYVANRDAGGDAFGFTETYSFDKYYFTETPKEVPEGEKWLYVDPGEVDVAEGNVLKEVKNLKGEVVFKIYN